MAKYRVIVSLVLIREDEASEYIATEVVAETDNLKDASNVYSDFVDSINN